MHRISDLFAMGILGCMLALSANAADARGGFKVIHNFAGGDGANPYGGVAPAPRGGFYVATNLGGASGEGALVLVEGDGTSQVLHGCRRHQQHRRGVPAQNLGAIKTETARRLTAIQTCKGPS